MNAMIAWPSRWFARLACGLAVALLLMSGSAPVWAQDEGEEDEKEHSESRFSDEPIPLADIPSRPRPLIELGERSRHPLAIDDEAIDDDHPL